jgi:hypothetical protein
MAEPGRRAILRLVAASPAEETQICGLGLLRQGSPETVRRLMDADPGVQQGLYCFNVMTWRTRPDR